MIEPSPNGFNNGRDTAGRFADGNAGGPGNPGERPTSRIRAAMMKAVTDADIEEIVRKLVSMAKWGDVAATRELFDRLLGRPGQTAIIEQLDELSEQIERLKTQRINGACRPLSVDGHQPTITHIGTGIINL
jgi:hypothetical protein